MKSKIIIGSRGSKLALIYAQKAKDKIIQNTKFNDDEVIIKEIKTKVIRFKMLDYQKLVEKVYFQQT